MCFLKKRNYRYNQTIPLPAGLINGQSLGAVSGMKFGLAAVRLSGCEIIAVYNALMLSGKPQPFREIACYMERYRVLAGFWGTNIFALGRCTGKFGVQAERVRQRSALEYALTEGKICLFVYWTGKRLLSSIHTVCMQAKGDQLWIYNASNRCGHAVQANMADYFSQRTMILGYIINTN